MRSPTRPEQVVALASCITDYLAQADAVMVEDGCYSIKMGPLLGHLSETGHVFHNCGNLIENLGGSLIVVGTAPDLDIYLLPVDFADRVAAAGPGGASSEPPRTAEVVELRNGLPVTPPDQPVADVVAAAELLLEQAKSGRIRGVALVTAVSTGEFCTAWSDSADARSWTLLMAGAGMLHYRMMREADGGEDH